MFDRSSLTRWRQRMGEEKLVALLQESLAVTAGLKPQNSVLSWERRTSRGRKPYQRKSNLMFGYVPLRFPSLQ